MLSNNYKQIHERTLDLIRITSKVPRLQEPTLHRNKGQQKGHAEEGGHANLPIEQVHPDGGLNRSDPHVVRQYESLIEFAHVI